MILVDEYQGTGSAMALSVRLLAISDMISRWRLPERNASSCAERYSENSGEFPAAGTNSLLTETDVL